jgi:hypothetical protein
MKPDRDKGTQGYGAPGREPVGRADAGLGQ